MLAAILAAIRAFFSRFATRPPPPAPPPGQPPKPTLPAGTKGAWFAICMTMLSGFEGLYTYAYKDVVGVTTICYGATNSDRKVRMGDKYTAAQCKEMLAEDIPKYAAPIEKCVKVEMPPNRKAAIVSFAYNVGPERACRSTVVRKLNAGDVRGACDALMMWNRGGGRVIKGLTNRRAAERKSCLRDD